tara:strand:+ start:164 stop:301 length:138 start_codon:yes stop_codon:yes gene_type:complete
VLEVLGGVAVLLLVLELCWWLAVAVFIRGYWSLSKDIKKIPIEYL